MPTGGWVWDAGRRCWKIRDSQGRWNYAEEHRDRATAAQSTGSASTSQQGSSSAPRTRQDSTVSDDVAETRRRLQRVPTQERTLPSEREHSSNAPRTRRDSTVDESIAETRRRLQRFQIPEHTQVDEAEQTSDPKKEHVRGQKSQVARDEKAGISTSWQVLYGGQYTNPDNTSEQRSVKVLRVGKGGGSDDVDENSGDDEEANDELDQKYQVGTVIEAIVVPPSEISMISAWTHATSQAQRRKYIIIRSRPEGRPCFRAVPIKTYDNEGVAQRGVIKHHHSQCYAGRDVPSIRRNERPQRLPSGHVERGMQPSPIRVVPRDRARTIDPMSRIKYSEQIEFAYDAPHVRVWGEVHRRSFAAFQLQYQSVWQDIEASLTGGGAIGRAGSSHAQTSQGSRSTQGGASTSGTVRPTPASSQNTASASGATGTGPISVREVIAGLRRWQNYARENGLTVPAAQVTEQEIQILAQNPEERRRYFDRIQEGLRREKEAQDASESEGSDDSDESGQTG